MPRVVWRSGQPGGPGGAGFRGERALRLAFFGAFLDAVAPPLTVRRQRVGLAPPPHGSPMFQIIFNSLSAAELSALPKALQLNLLGEFQVLPEDLERRENDRFGLIERGGKKLYRYRASDYRIYFEPCAGGVTVHRILHKNTISDFLFRSKLPMVAEDEKLGETQAFWKLIDEGAKAKAA